MCYSFKNPSLWSTPMNQGMHVYMHFRLQSLQSQTGDKEQTMMFSAYHVCMWKVCSPFFSWEECTIYRVCKFQVKLCKNKMFGRTVSVAHLENFCNEDWQRAESPTWAVAKVAHGLSYAKSPCILIISLLAILYCEYYSHLLPLLNSEQQDCIQKFIFEEESNCSRLLALSVNNFWMDSRQCLCLNWL